MVKYIKASPYDDIYNEVYTERDISAGADYELFFVGIPMGIGSNEDFEYDLVVEIQSKRGLGNLELNGTKLCRVVPGLMHFSSLSHLYPDDINIVIDAIDDYFDSIGLSKLDDVVYSLLKDRDKNTFINKWCK